MIFSTRQLRWLLLFFLLIIPDAVAAADDPVAREYLKLSGLAGDQESLIRWQVGVQDSLCPLGAEAASVLRKEIESSVAANQLVPAYCAVVRRTFSQEELESLSKFYSSPLGNRFVQQSGTVDAKGWLEVQRLQGFWKRDLFLLLGKPLDLYLLSLPDEKEGTEAALAKYSAAHRGAAAKLLEASGWADHFKAQMKERVEIYAEEQKKLPSKVQERLNKIASWETSRSSFSALLMEAFSETEMRELLEFYSTPTGKKLATVRDSLSGQLLDVTNGALRERYRLLLKEGC